MSNTSSRTLRLLSLLQSRRYWPGPVLAERLGVSARTLRRDVDRLRELGYPVDAQVGVAGGYALAPGASLPPLVMDDDEAMALGVAIWSHVAAGATGDDGDAALRALTKVIQVMPRRLRTRLDAVRTTTTTAPWGLDDVAPVGHDVLAVVVLACRDRERIRLSYTAIDGASSDRVVEPTRIVLLGRRWYLVAFDLDRRDWRTFRIDRIGAAEGTGLPYAPRTPPFDDAAGFVRERVQGGSAGGRYRVEVVIDAPAEVVARRVGAWAEVTPRNTGTCTLTMTTDTLAGPIHTLGALGADFTIVAPPELAAAIADRAERFARAATRSDSPDQPGLGR